jgi:hypothetical protein
MFQEDNWLDETWRYAVEHANVGYSAVTHGLVRQQRIFASVTRHSMPQEALSQPATVEYGQRASSVARHRRETRMRYVGQWLTT